MIINSNFRDYYDTSNGGWLDKTIVYNRKEEDINDNRFLKRLKNNIDYIDSTTHSSRDNDIKTIKEFSLVGFCGKFYVLYHYKKYHTLTDEVIKESYNYNRENIDTYINDIDVSKYYLKYNKYKLTKLENLYRNYNNKEDYTLFIKYKTPILFIDIYKFNIIKKDIKLNDIEFFKVKDSFTAYNDLEIFLSNVILTNEKEPLESTDKIKILSKGFDYKYSFRKEKSK